MAGKIQVVVASRIKEIAKAKKVRVSGEFADAANAAAIALIEKAIARTKANGRQTLKPQDI